MIVHNQNMGNGKNCNSGIDILKVSACFGVVFLHFGNGGGIATLSVPVFMFVSACLCGRLFTDGTWRELFIRLRRLYVPFAVWGVSYWLMFCLFNRSFDIVVLIKQLAIGAPACPVLYFLFLLACYSIMLFYVGHMRRRFWALPLVLVICLALQYSGLNATVFNRYSFDFRMVLGRFVELLPPCFGGVAATRLAALVFGVYLWHPVFKGAAMVAVSRLAPSQMWSVFPVTVCLVFVAIYIVSLSRIGSVSVGTQAGKFRKGLYDKE
ncbi:MAG: acyltransferase family protein [Kiritimatiellae bacterium]|nr:acyltransferase family protein [Kiritimatiellia bacterium]